MAGSVVDEFRAFLEQNSPRWQAEWGANAQSWEALCAWQRVMSSGRWSAPSWPVEFGGRGLGPLDVFALEQMQADEGLPRLPGTLGLKNVGPTLHAWGTDEQKLHLPAILSAEEIWCQGFSEPGAGSDLASLRTRAVRDGDDFVINGQKIWTSSGMHATHMQLLARTDPEAPKHKGISALIVDMTTPGIEVRPIRQINGEAEFAEVFFTDVRVPAANLLGPLNDGWRVTMTTLGHERAGVAIFAARLEKRARQSLLEAAGGGSHSQLALDGLVSLYVESQVVSALGQRILDGIAEGNAPGSEQSIIKLVWSELSQRLDGTLADNAGPALVLGGAPGVAKDYLGARAATIAAGTTQIVRNILAERVLGLPR